VQLGQAGRELGGLDIDRWLADDFAARLGFDADTRRRLKATLIRKAEAAKIALSEDPLAQVELRSDRAAGILIPREVELARSRTRRAATLASEGYPPPLPLQALRASAASSSRKNSHGTCATRSIGRSRTQRSRPGCAARTSRRWW
jgi:hypothetical protein